MYRRHSLQSGRRRQHDVLALAAAPGVAAARAAAVFAVAAGVVAARGGGGPQEAIRSSRWCLMCRTQLSHAIQTGKNNGKLTIILEIWRQRSVYMKVLVRNVTWAGP